MNRSGRFARRPRRAACVAFAFAIAVPCAAVVTRALAGDAAPSGGGAAARGDSVQLDASALGRTDVAPNGSLTNGSTRLDPLLPGGGGRSASGSIELTASVGQPTVAATASSLEVLQPGFWTPVDGTALGRVFADGFEG